MDPLKESQSDLEESQQLLALLRSKNLTAENAPAMDALNADLKQTLQRLEETTRALNKTTQSQMKTARQTTDDCDSIAQYAEQIQKSAKRMSRMQRLNKLTAIISVLSLLFGGYLWTLPEGRTFLATAVVELPGRLLALLP